MNITTNKRYDLFNLIHKGIRAMLYNMGLALQLNDFKNRKASFELFENIYEVLLVTSDHSKHENSFILPLVAKFNLMVVRDFEAEHLAGEAIAHRLKNLVALYHHAARLDEMLDAGNALYKTFNEFIAFNINHMNREEEVLNSLLWKHYTDEEIYLIYKAIASSIPPDKVTIHGRWVMRGISNNEIINWLLSYHGSHPEAFQFLLQLAENELPEERWTDIREALCEGEMLPCGCENLA